MIYQSRIFYSEDFAWLNLICSRWTRTSRNGSSIQERLLVRLQNILLIILICIDSLYFVNSVCSINVSLFMTSLCSALDVCGKPVHLLSQVLQVPQVPRMNAKRGGSAGGPTDVQCAVGRGFELFEGLHLPGREPFVVSCYSSLPQKE